MTKPIAWALFGLVAVVVIGVFSLGLDGGVSAAGWATITALVVFSSFAVLRRLVGGSESEGAAWRDAP